MTGDYSSIKYTVWLVVWYFLFQVSLQKNLGLMGELIILKIYPYLLIQVLVKVSAMNN